MREPTLLSCDPGVPLQAGSATYPAKSDRQPPKGTFFEENRTFFGLLASHRPKRICRQGRKIDSFSAGNAVDVGTPFPRPCSLFHPARPATCAKSVKNFEWLTFSKAMSKRANDKIRVRAQLFDAKTGAQVWSENYDEEMAHVFAIQAAIAKKVANKLRAKLSPTERAAIELKPASDLAAFSLYARGKTLVDLAGSDENAEEKFPIGNRSSGAGGSARPHIPRRLVPSGARSCHGLPVRN
jgi:hypothetical protein